MRIVTDDERRARLGVRHALAQRVADVESAARAVTCLHATEPASVYLSAFARSGATRTAIDHALYTERSLVRQLAMRRTVFAFPRDLFPAVRGSVSARVAAQLRARLAKDVVASGITEDGDAWVAETVAQVLELLHDAPTTTLELRAKLPALTQRLTTRTYRATDTLPVAPQVLSVLAAEGTVVRGRNQGGWKISRPCWTLTAQWLNGDPGTLDAAAGYAELVRRWLWSFGPGTEADLVWWLGATKGIVRQALETVGAAAVLLEDGSPAWLHPDDIAEVTTPAPWTALLPALDPTTMGWQGRSFYLGERAAAIFDRAGNGGPTAWWNGRIVGGWSQRDDGTVFIVPFDSLPFEAAELLERQAAELTAWLDGDIVRSIYQTPLVRSRQADSPVR